MHDDEFFIGWAPTPARDRRFLLRAALGLVAFSGLSAALIAAAQGPPGRGRWDQSDVRGWEGVLVREPFPMLRTTDLDGTPRTAFLATSGKLGVQHRLPAGLSGPVIVRGSLIARGRHAMIAVVDGPGWIEITRMHPDRKALLSDWPEDDFGEALLVGEVLDSKCWFGAMRPGAGKTHKECASLCLRGGLPPAFCAGGANCGEDSAAPLLLDSQGRPHGDALLPYAADPVRAMGRLVRVGDVTQFRVNLSDIVRL